MASLSVIIATYNRAQLLEKAIDSVARQTYKDLELIIADDGSTDETRNTVERYLRSNSSLHEHTQYFRHENQGKSVALNEALLRTNSEWVAFLDSDDQWLPDKLQLQFDTLRRFPSSVACFTDFTCINNPNMDTTGFRFHGVGFPEPVGLLRGTASTLLNAPLVSIVTLLCRTQLVRDVGGFDPHLRFTEDYDFLFRLALRGDFCFVNQPLAIVDRGAPSERHTGAAAVWDDIDFRLYCEQYRYEKWLKLGSDLPKGARRTIIQKLRAVHSSRANQYLVQGDYERARGSIWAAAKYQITPHLVVKWLLTRMLPSVMTDLAIRRGGFNTEYF